jgi:regulator of sigma E protease
MEGEAEESDSENSLEKKPKWQRFLVFVAGAVMNLLCGFLLLTVLVLVTPKIAGTTVADFHEDATSVQSGLQIGDTIVAVDGIAVHTGYDLNYTVFLEATKPVDLTVIRDGERIVLSDVVFPSAEEEGVTMGTTDFRVYAVPKTFGNVVKECFVRSVTSVRMVWDSLVGLLTGRYGVDQMSGPVGITTEIGNAAKANDGGIMLLSLSALIAVNLGVMNLLPIPVLDGGHILFLVIEAIRRKPVKRQVREYVQLVFMLLLLLLMVMITFSDVTKLVR